MKNIIRANLMGILLVILLWNVMGLVIGSMASVMERDARTYNQKTNTYTEDGKTGCVYKSVSAFTNIGFILGCELFRERFDYEGIDKVFSKEAK